MSKPILLTVDDDPEVLNAIERDLRQHFRTDYRIVKASSGAQALETITELKQRGSQLALFLVDERMPHMTGTQFLSEAIKVFPDARKVLLTAYADTETAIKAINQIGLDHYLMKPWEPPSTRLYPVLEDLLSEWHAKARPTFDGIRVAGSPLSQASFAVKDFLASNHVPYQWLDMDDEATVRDLLSGVPGGAFRQPLVFFPDGTTLVQPTTRQLAEKVSQIVSQPLDHSRPLWELYLIEGLEGGRAAVLFKLHHASVDGVSALNLHETFFDQAPTGRELVPARRQRHGDLPVGAPVELGRPPRAGPAPFGQPPELDLQQAVRDEAVEVELDGVPRQAGSRGGRVPAHRRVLPDHVAVQGAARRIRQRSHPAHLSREVVLHRPSSPR